MNIAKLHPSDARMPAVGRSLHCGIGLTVGASGSSAATSQASGPIQVTYGGSPASKVALYAIIAAVILVGLVIWMKRK